MQWCEYASHLGERLGDPDDDGGKYHGEGDGEGDEDRDTVREQ